MPTVNQSEAARRLGVSRRTIKRRIDAGDLPTVDTPEGLHVVLPDPDAPTPPTGHAQGDAHHAPTPEDLRGAANFVAGDNFVPPPPNVPAPGHLDPDLAARLERAESRIDRLLETVHEQNRTIQAQTIRLAQIEGRVLDAQTPTETPPQPTGASQPAQGPHTTPARRGGLRAWYVRWRGGH